MVQHAVFACRHVMFLVKLRLLGGFPAPNLAWRMEGPFCSSHMGPVTNDTAIIPYSGINSFTSTGG